MRAWLELWVRLKVVDLVTQTVWMTLTEKLDFAGDLCGLVHYSYWGMYAEGMSRESIIEEIDRVIRMDSAFTNQNKHCYRLMFREPSTVTGDAGAGGHTAGEADDVSARGDLALDRDFPVENEDRCGADGARLYAFDCLIREKKPDREKGFEQRIGSRLDTSAVSGLRAGEVWRIILRAGAREEALDKIERMLVTRSRREGLLLNPHYQQYDVISAVLVGGRE